MRILFISFALAFFLTCVSEHQDTLDDQLRFIINTSENSRGISGYTMPGSLDFNNIPQDSKNPLSINKVELGKLLFHETAFSTAGNFDRLSQTYSCASCHHAGAGFQSGMMQGIGDGGIGFGMAGEGRVVDFEVAMNDIDVQALRTPSAMNGAYQTNVQWNGQFGATAINKGTEALWDDGTLLSLNRLGYEGLETQAIAGIDIHRISYTKEAIEALGYKDLFDEALSALPEDLRYSAEGAGLAIAAYERTLLSNRAPFQKWLRGDIDALTEEQKKGAILFFSSAQCNQCHYGPSLAGMEFHALGFGDFDQRKVANFTADDPAMLGRGSFTQKYSDNYKFKVPQLYNLKDSPFHGHGGTFNSIRDVIDYKNTAISQNQSVPTHQLSEDFKPLGLSQSEIDQITDFIENGLYDPDLDRYVPDFVNSLSCFPNNDELSRQDLGCD